MKLTLFDLDHTLLDGDSDQLWCNFLIAQGLLDAAEFGPRNAEIERGYRAGTIGVEAFCSFYIGTLAGHDAAFWEPWRQRFLRDEVLPRIGPPSRALVERHQAAGDLVAMTSATNRFLCELTASDLGIEHLIATECEIDADGRFTGRIAGVPNMREGKVRRLHDWLVGRGLTLEAVDSTAYSDSINDLPLLRAVHHAVAVNPDPRLASEAAQRGWPVISLRS